MDSGNTWSTAQLGDYFVLLRRQWVSILVCLLLGLAAAGAYLALAPREYSAKTSVLVTETIAGPSEAARVEGINLDTEAQLVTSTGTVTAALENGAPSRSVDDLAGRVSVSVPPNTEILDIAFTAPTAAEAQAGSLAFAEAYLDQRRATAEESLEAGVEALQARIDSVGEQLEAVVRTSATLAAGSSARARAERQADVLNGQLANLTSEQGQVRSTSITPGRIVTQPTLPSAPSRPSLPVTLAAGALLGLVLGLGVGHLRQRSDDVLHEPEDVFRRTRVPVAAVLGGRLHEGEVSLVAPLSSDGRGYARLRNLVTTSLRESNRRVILVAGVRRGGGPVAANLAASLGRAGEEVHLVCADVFGSTAAELLGTPTGPGLSEVLDGSRPVEDALRRLPEPAGVRVLGPGDDPDRADALLQTHSPRRLVDHLLQSASYVVIEAPATTESADAQTLADVSEAAVLVVEEGHTTGREVLDACAQLESMGTPVLGVVVARYERSTGRRPTETAKPGPGRSEAAKAEVVETEEAEVVETGTVEAGTVEAGTVEAGTVEAAPEPAPAPGAPAPALVSERTAGAGTPSPAETVSRTNPPGPPPARPPAVPGPPQR